MPPAAGAVASSDRVAVGTMVMPTVIQPAPAMMQETFAKDAIIAWFRGEFAAANAIIDALCSHLTELEGGVVGPGTEYESVFAAIHRRRLNWIPILQMQKYYSIADVALELRKVAEKKVKERELSVEAEKNHEGMNQAVSLPDKESSSEVPISEEEILETNGSVVPISEEEILETNENGKCESEVVDENSAKDDSPQSEITDTGSQEVQPSLENIDICSNHEGCEARRDHIKITKGFIAKEPVKGHMVNVVRGLKLYEDVFTEIELSKLNDFVNELRIAGQNGELSGETFILYNQQVLGSKRELIQFGVPIFGQTKEDVTNKHPKSHIEPIPALLHGIIEHLIQWRIIAEIRKPNGCIINFFDEGEYSQPFVKPPHLDQPITTLLLSEAKMAFGRTLVNDNEGNYRGPLLLSLKEGSLLVMRGNSADVARHVMCSSLNKRVSITFVKIHMEDESSLSPLPSPNRAMNLWQPGFPTPNPTPNGANGYEEMALIPKWGALRATPVVMLAPFRPMVMTPRRVSRGGTGVFLPWTVGSRKPTKHLPPRAQKSHLLALPSPVEACEAQAASDASFNIDQKVL